MRTRQLSLPPLSPGESYVIAGAAGVLFCFYTNATGVYHECTHCTQQLYVQLRTTAFGVAGCLIDVTAFSQWKNELV